MKKNKKHILNITKNQGPSNRLFKLTIISITLVSILLFIIIFGAPLRYQLQIGDIAKDDILAPTEIKDKLTTELLKNEAADNIDPVYTFKKEATDSSQKKLYNILATIQTIRQNENLNLNEKIEYLKTYLSKYIELSENKLKLSLQLSDNEFSNFQIILLDIHRLIMEKGIVDGEMDKALGQVRDMINEKEISDEFKDLAFAFLSNVIEPNKAIDKEATLEAKKNAMAEVEPVVYSEGEKIVSEGDLITKEQYNVLKELDLIKTGSYDVDYLFIICVISIILILLLIISVYINNYFHKIFMDVKNVLLICIIFVATTGFVALLKLVDYNNIYLIPLLASAMIVSMLFGARLAILTNFILVIICSLIIQGDIGFISTALIVGTISTFIIRKAEQRSKIALSGLVIMIVNALLIINYSIIAQNDIRESLINGSLGIVIGFIATILAIGVLPFIETTFNIITPLKLLELSNPNQKLIKRLLLEAPGTYHHSLMVGNLAEAATESIGGNPLLARVAAYYHDIGKLNRPYFFKENQYNENPHDKMAPSLSTLVVTSHVKDGVELAKEYNIPPILRDIIKQHHGTTLVKYFYHKAVNDNKDKEVSDKEYRYEGPKPQSKEAAVVMLADSVEAAVRSMNEKTEGLVEGLVRKIIKDKLEDGQFDESDITLKDLDTVARSFMKVLSGIFHERIEYPDVQVDNDNKQQISM